MSGYYRVLGVSRFADPEQIRAAYWSLSRRLRREIRAAGADLRPSRLTQLRRAFETLSDAERRRRYDASLDGTDVRGAERSIASGPDPVLPAVAADTRAIPAAREDACGGFPSMTRLRPRLRRAFDATPAGRMLRRHAEISVDEARAGARVTVEVEAAPSCPHCAGRGEVWAEPCGVCQGRGEATVVHPMVFAIPSGVRHGAVLRFPVTLPYAAASTVALHVTIQ